jgi:hypothetical protein
MEILSPHSISETVGAAVSSDHLLRKFCRDSLNFIEPVPIYINDESVRVLVGHYVPILHNISQYLEHRDVWASFQQQYICKDSVLQDYTDGCVREESELPSSHIRLHLYTDEFETCNPLGSRKGVHKLCAFYFTVGNVDVKYRSQLKNIHLARLLNYKHVQNSVHHKLHGPLDCMWDLRCF